jgi:hypothetical protein
MKSLKVNYFDLVTRFNMSDTIAVPSRRPSGGLWIMWSDDLQVHVHSSSFYIILAIATISANGQIFALVCFYGDPYHCQTSMIWDQAATFPYDNCIMPMICIKDMNKLLYDIDKNSSNVNLRLHECFSLSC